VRAGETRLALALGAVALLLYLPSLGNGFVNWDDDGYVTANPRAQRLTAENVRWALTTFHKANWHPLTWISHMADGSLYGLDPRGHHLTSILLHAANAALLFLALRRLTGDLAPSALAAALFALHPLNVEAVSWVAARKTVLSTFFWLLAMIAYAGYTRRPSRRRYAAVALLLALGLTAKAMLVTLPLAFLLLDAWPLRRLSRRAVIEKVPLLALAATSTLVTLAAARAGEARASLATLPLGMRGANALLSYAGYLRNAVFPRDLSAFYPMPGTIGAPPMSAAAVLGAAALLLAITIACAAARRSAPHLFVGWLWFVGTLVPVIGLAQAGSQAMADRFAYVPLIGLFVAAAWSVPGLRARRPPWPVAAAVLAVLALFAATTVARERVWRDSEALWRDTLARNPRCLVALLNYGSWLSGQGRHDEAIARFRDLLALAPAYPGARARLGEARSARARALAGKSDFDGALAEMRAALDDRPDSPEGHNNLGMILLARGDLAQAEGAFREAIRLRPRFAVALVNLAETLRRSGRTADAAPVLREAAAAAAAEGDTSLARRIDEQLTRLASPR
jgi:tetratricopeptide (TPR) repeat protein